MLETVLFSDAIFFPFPHTFHSFLAEVSGSPLIPLLQVIFYLSANLFTLPVTPEDMAEVFTVMNGQEEVTCAPSFAKHKIIDFQACARINSSDSLPFPWAVFGHKVLLGKGST